MGCAGSKLDDLEAVALCRERFQRLEEAIQFRYELSNAHDSYLQAICRVGDALQRFVDGGNLASPPPSVLHLPTQRKGHPMPPLSPAASPARAAAAANVVAPTAPVHHLSRSNSGSHIIFHPSDSDLSDEDDGHLHSGHSSPLDHPGPSAGMEFMSGGIGQTTYLHYAKKGPSTSAVTYEQPAMNSEVVQVGESSEYSYLYPSREAGYYANPYPPAYSAYGGMGSFFGVSSAPAAVATPPPPSSKQPPPPPSPPTISSWDFLDPFQSYDNFYQSYTPSRSSNAVREEEGIPDLEEEESEVIKEAYGHKKPAAGSSAVNAESYSSGKAAVDVSGRRIIGEPSHYKARSSGFEVDDQGHEVNPAEKNVVTNEVQTRLPPEVNARKSGTESRVASDVVQEINALFYRASKSCDSVSRMMEVGKPPYRRKNYLAVTSKMRNAIMPHIPRHNLPPTSAEDENPVFWGSNEEKAMKTGNLSSTLQKLYMWEKKLYEEVRAEEKMRLLHERKCKQLKRMDERGSEAEKIARTEHVVKKLSTRIKIAIQVVDSISKKITMLRDVELWPQINELIKGFVTMWEVMRDCHRSQCQAMFESRNLDDIVSGGKFSDAHMEATKQLELSLLGWIDAFLSWFDAQKKLVMALNQWFFKCIIYKPEVTADGIVPFSPGRLGAPTVFIVCNQWLLTMDDKSYGEALAAMQSFAANVLQLWEQHRLIIRQKMMANSDLSKRIKAQEREEQVVYRTVEVLNKKLLLELHQNPPSEVNSLQEGLKRIFVAMERFSEASLKTYEGLLARSEEERI